ncbi:MAG: 6-phosphofructokinase [Deltaproteobacteria bacterium]|nr:6-phosphofructokinase [Deltaproteobacteria bacterium]
MTQNEPTMLNTFLALPEVKKITGKISDEITERKAYAPERCQAFDQSFTVLEDRQEFAFELDPEAKKQLPHIINNPVQSIKGVPSLSEAKAGQYKRPRRIGIVFSGGPAPGGHNVIAGIFDAAQKANPENRLFGFLMGPAGVIENRYVEITRELVDAHRNLGGFSMIKTGRTKIDTEKKMSLSKNTCQKLKLDALVVVGGDDSNTNAAFLAEEMFTAGIQIIGVPKTIDGDIQVRDKSGEVLCAMSFGFHTAARSFGKEISNLCTDCSSDVKYWHICKVMGRVASHIALEVALQTHANITLIGEDLADYVDHRRLKKMTDADDIDYSAYGMTLRHLSRVICDCIVRRSAAGKNYGVIVIPEGVLEFVNEIQVFIIKLNTIIGKYNDTHDRSFHAQFPLLDDKTEYLRRLSRGDTKGLAPGIWNARDDELFNDLPQFFQEGLLTERDSHGNFQFSLVETDKVLLGLVNDYLNILREKGEYKLGIETTYYRETMKRGSLDPNFYGPILFKNYNGATHYLVKPEIISLKTLKQALTRGNAIRKDEKIPAAVEKIFKESVPKFKTQPHFYGYDGRGSDPTRFDCMYTYNLGHTVFSLIANGATGQMAAIKNLEDDFTQWEPIGVPIAPLMHLEERKGKLALVIEKSVVNINSPAFKVVKAYREKWLAATPENDDYRRPGPIRFTGKSEEDRPITLMLNALWNKSTVEVVSRP